MNFKNDIRNRKLKRDLTFKKTVLENYWKSIIKRKLFMVDFMTRKWKNYLVMVAKNGLAFG